MSNNLIRKYGDPILREVCKPVGKVSETERKIFTTMIELMDSNEGIGLAAPQIGISRRIIVAKFDSYLLKLIDPRIIEKKGEEILTEGCLSIPEVYIKVPRAKKIKVQALDEDGKTRVIQADGMLSRIIQHEVDHLNGILIIDYATEKEKDKIKNQLKRIKTHTKMILKVKNKAFSSMNKAI